MTVFLCSKCGTAITPELADLVSIHDASDDARDRDQETRRAASTVQRGHYVVDPEPWGPPYVVQTARTARERPATAKPVPARHQIRSKTCRRSLGGRPIYGIGGSSRSHCSPVRSPRATSRSFHRLDRRLKRFQDAVSSSEPYISTSRR